MTSAVVAAPNDIDIDIVEPTTEELDDMALDRMLDLEKQLIDARAQVKQLSDQLLETSTRNEQRLAATHEAAHQAFLQTVQHHEQALAYYEDGLRIRQERNNIQRAYASLKTRYDALQLKLKVASRRT